jgi:hypothetical protein
VYGAPSTSLFYITGQAARGRTAEEIERHASARDLDRLTVAEAQQQLQKRFAPANAALAIAGNLSSVGDMRRLVQNLFGALPAGERWKRSAPDSLHPGDRIVQFQRAVPLGWAVGIIAPALADSSHPSFYLGSLMLGSLLREAWRSGDDTLSVRLFYTLLDEPDLVRIIPPVDPKMVTTDELAHQVQGSIDDLFRLVLTGEDYDNIRRQWAWVLGGPLSDEMLARVRVDPAPIHSLARCMAGREVQGGEEFWAGYRRRFWVLPPGGIQALADYYTAPEHQVRLVVLPGK